MKTLIIANPMSGSFNRNLLKECSARFRDKYGPVEIEYTKMPCEASKIASESDAELIVAAGGDGLINEAASGIINKDVLFTALPFGTVNVFCREHKIPLNPVKAAEKLNVDNQKRISVGFLGKHPFLLMCGFGYDANVVRSVVSKRYLKNKSIAHMKEGLKLFNIKYPELCVYINGEQIKAYHIIISIGSRYAGSFSLSDKIQENTLNVFIQQKNKPQSLFYSFLSVFVGGGFPAAPVFTDMLKINGTPHAQLDGEYVDTGVIQNYVTIMKASITIALQENMAYYL